MTNASPSTLIPSSSLPSAWISNARALLLGAATLLLSGCAVFGSYNQKLSGPLARVENGDIEGAIQALGKKGSDDDLLYQLELGELLRLRQSFDDSEKAWLKADQTVLAWENVARRSPKKLLPSAAAFLVNDKVRTYEGHDYEKVMLTTRLALNHLATGDFAKARVAIKRTHERETLIAELRAKEQEKLEEEAKKKGAKTSFKDLGGYPTESLDNTAVNALRNSYQSAFSHYLAGYVYEALDEPSLAAPGYRMATELRPGIPLLEDALASLDSRVAGPASDETDVLFVIETGSVSGRRSEQFTLPLLVNWSWIYVPMSFPVMDPQRSGPVPLDIQVPNTDPLPVYTITDIDAMARRALRDEMPAIMLRSVFRATVKGIAQAKARHNDKVGLGFLAVALASVLTETADERGWRTLPNLISVARGRLRRGEQTISLNTPNGARSFSLKVSGRHMVVAVRLLANSLYVLSPDKVNTAAPIKAQNALPLTSALSGRSS